jgi:hypothetical protein
MMVARTVKVNHHLKRSFRAHQTFGELVIIMNFNDQTVTWGTDTIQLRRDTCTLSSAEALVEVYLSTNEPQTLRDKYFWATMTLDAEYKQVFASLDDAIKTFENLHVEELHQLKK